MLSHRGGIFARPRCCCVRLSVAPSSPAARYNIGLCRNAQCQRRTGESGNSHCRDWTKSDSNGNFVFPTVPATYSISVQIGGFTRQEQKDITVTSGERRSVGTLSLVVGSISDSVTVQAGITQVQTESADRSASIDRHEMGALLARGLNYGSLAESSGNFRRRRSERPGWQYHDLSEHQRNSRQLNDSKY